MLQLKNYVNTHNKSTPWCCIPRHLNWLQYHRPYKVLKKFTLSQPLSKWKKILRLLLAYALRPASIAGIIKIEKLLKVWKLLAQLIEACHLIVVRTTAPVAATVNQ